MAKLAILGGDPVRSEGPNLWPVFSDRERELLVEVLNTRNWGGFPEPNTYAREFAEKFAEYHDAKYGICAANGTVTLEIALKAGGVKAHDEVIVPAISWIATAQAPVFVNAVPVFVDIDPKNYCIDPQAIEDAITDRTRAIIPVHLGYQIADMDAIMDVAKKHDLIVVEDCAHAHGGRWNGKGVGSIGHFGSFSFQT
ncbi:MAG TPA: aminotransferase class I/II-fold pyridoxal phosphate-dependent enzyme, partial [Proteobacteria bacterium]|nr:aminotransferase class I/II-fold pyridoxal phosphate-dependent enzyme [Pseudomonadota bacterium]